MGTVGNMLAKAKDFHKMGAAMVSGQQVDAQVAARVQGLNVGSGALGAMAVDSIESQNTVLKKLCHEKDLAPQGMPLKRSQKVILGQSGLNMDILHFTLIPLLGQVFPAGNKFG